MDNESPIFGSTPPDFRIADVKVHPALPDEHTRWDELMDRHHYSGFRRFPGRGLRYVFGWRGLWISLAGRQASAFRCRPRDRWIGWSPDPGSTACT